MDYKNYFEKMRKEHSNITIVFFKTFSKIVVLPERLAEYSRLNLEFKEDSLTYNSVAYSSQTGIKLGDDCPTKYKYPDVKFTITINYSDIIGFVCYKSKALDSCTIVTTRDFNKTRDELQEEIDTLCESLVK